MEPPKTDPVVGPLASKLQRLRYLKRRKDGQRFDINEIAEEVSRLYTQDKILVVRQKLTDAGATADEITAAVDEAQNERGLLERRYLSDLLNGRRRNPTKNILEYLAIFFGVSPAYFFEGRERTDATTAAEGEIEMMLALRQLKKKLEEGGEENAGQLLLAMMRGSGDLDARTATGMIHMHVAAIKHAKGEESAS